jgi:hypothetical protein
MVVLGVTGKLKAHSLPEPPSMRTTNFTGLVLHPERAKIFNHIFERYWYHCGAFEGHVVSNDEAGASVR